MSGWDLLESIAKTIDSFTERLGASVAWIALALTLLTAYDTLARYLFHSGSIAMQELEWHLFSALFLLSAGYALKSDAHVRVDILYSGARARTKAIINLLGSLIFLIPLSALIIHTSIPFVENSFAALEKSPNPGGLPARYILKALIPIGFAALGAQGIAESIRAALELFAPGATRSGDHAQEPTGATRSGG